jgi:hypothetical protein
VRTHRSSIRSAQNEIGKPLTCDLKIAEPGNCVRRGALQDDPSRNWIESARPAKGPIRESMGP